MSDQRRRIAIHEAAHGVMAASLRQPVRFLSVRPTEHYGGVMVSAPRRHAPHDSAVVRLPTILWPARTRRTVEIRAFVSLAGPVADLYLGPYGTAFLTPTDDEAAAEADARALARVHPTIRTAVTQTEASSEPLTPDEDSALINAIALGGRDEAVAWLAWARAAVAHILVDHTREIEAVADELAVRTVISGRRMKAVMQSTHPTRKEHR